MEDPDATDEDSDFIPSEEETTSEAIQSDNSISAGEANISSHGKCNLVLF